MNNWISPHFKAEFEQIALQEINKLKEKKEEKFLSNLPEPNYILIDAVVWEPYMDEILNSQDITYCSLFATRGADHGLDIVAPYLLAYTHELALWMNEGKKQELKRLFINSDQTIEALRKHLRGFLRVKSEAGKWLFFRFYDPYVANSVFPNLTKEQAMDFFEKIEYIVTEDIRIGERRIFYLPSDKELQIVSQKID